MAKNIMCLCLLFLGVNMEMESQNRQDVFALVAGKYLQTPMTSLSVGEGGDHCVWDFSNLKRTNSTQIVLCKVDSLGQIEVSDDKHVAYYAISGDTVYQTGRESPLEILQYSSPVCCLKLPLEFNDSIFKEFEGEGLYCDDHYVKEKGCSKVVVDGIGDIVFSSADTLRNVLRVYKEKVYAVAMDMLIPALDSTKLKQIIEERYEWYAKGEVFPLFSTITTTKYVNLSPISTSHFACCCIPYDFSDLQDYIQNKDSLDRHDEGHQADIIHYKVCMATDKLTINFNLDTDASVSMLLANNMGVVYDSKRIHLAKDTGYQLNFDISALKPGVYVVYINVDGKVYSEKIKK